MELLIDNRTDTLFDNQYIQIIETVINESLKQENVKDNVEISVSIVSNEEIQEINRKFRNIDKPTDVLSFPLCTPEEIDEWEKNTLLALGDIIISIEKAHIQAQEYGHSFERELGFLTAHSMLHLLGYDHMEPEEEKEMMEKQERILRQIGLKR